MWNILAVLSCLSETVIVIILMPNFHMKKMAFRVNFANFASFFGSFSPVDCYCNQKTGTHAEKPEAGELHKAEQSKASDADWNFCSYGIN